MMERLNDTSNTLALLKTRRSTVAKDMVPPGPGDEQLAELLEIAARVPDHGKLAPWRFVVFQEEARTAFGDILSKRFAVLNPTAGADLREFERARFERAPVVVGVVSTAAPHTKIPEWEQQLSAGAVCQNLLIAATAMGFAAQWLTEWYAFDDEIAKAIGLTGTERMAGFVYIASRAQEPSERVRPDLSERTSRWQPEANS